MEKQDKIALGLAGVFLGFGLFMTKSKNKSISSFHGFRNADGTTDYKTAAASTETGKKAKANLDSAVSHRNKLAGWLSEFNAKKNALVNLGVDLSGDPNSNQATGRGTAPGISEYVFETVFGYPHPYMGDPSKSNSDSIWNISISPSSVLAYRDNFRSGNIKLGVLRSRIFDFFNTAEPQIAADLKSADVAVSTAQTSYNTIISKEAKRLADEAVINAQIQATEDASKLAMLEAEAKKIEQERLADEQRLRAEELESGNRIKKYAIIGGVVIALGALMLMRK